MKLQFEILGEPVSKARPRFGNGRTFTDAKTSNYEHTVAELGAYHAAVQRWPRAFSGLCAVSITAVFARPQDRHRKKDPRGRMPRERGRIDCDNVAKAILDGLQKGGVFHNDSQVVDLHVRLWWTAIEEGPRVGVEISAIPEAIGDPHP